MRQLVCVRVGRGKWVGVVVRASFCLLGFEKAGIEGDVDLGKAPAGFFVCTASLSLEKPGSSSLSELIVHHPRVLDFIPQ